MSRLREEHPSVYKYFSAGMHVVRRSDKSWAGLSTDLIIEQVLMRSVKTNGGLTRGRGMTDAQRSIWLMSIPACSQMSIVLQDLCGVTYSTSDQHQEMTKSRQERDRKDISTLLQFLQTHDPFKSDNEGLLTNIATGVTADTSVNVDKAKDVGLKILLDLHDQKVHDYSFRKKNQVVTMGRKSTIPVGSDNILVDPQLLFQRLIIAGERCGELPLLFMHEMCTYPPSLFESPDMMRSGNKSDLADALWGIVGREMIHELPEDAVFVLDGGSLLHRLSWPQGVSFGDLAVSYVRYVTTKYGARTTVVFDGYMNGPSTKDQTHKRRSKGQ